ncbi:MAG: hypothetical protein CVU60_15200 [Deltaproteobacteria bacterium HGW-Deltaproteobacteria-18]|nr:MAG: hypothetical protein CVU60_15200 [Deltaproteobacteria bacterium HGW-Deltaproteobacteria-18]
MFDNFLFHVRCLDAALTAADMARSPKFDSDMVSAPLSTAQPEEWGIKIGVKRGASLALT